MRYISPEHYVGQYIEGFKMLANVSWDTVDNIIISINVSKSFHVIMILFCIRHGCLYMYDSFIGSAVNTKNVLVHVQSLATIIPLFLFATNFYGKQADICWDREPGYIDKSIIDPLKYVIVRDIPRQAPQSNDCGMYACAFAEFIIHGLFDISTNMFNATNHRMRYGVLLWDYARKKQNNDVVTESEPCILYTELSSFLKYETDFETETVGSSYLTDMPLLSLRGPTSNHDWEGINTLPWVKPPHLPSSRRYDVSYPPSSSRCDVSTYTNYVVLEYKDRI
ncbi:hypothetical protein BC332_30406 [Capsicum chinense]|nr:hypothetical protein BC332_30406 [Capsicum chinense]